MIDNKIIKRVQDHIEHYMSVRTNELLGNEGEFVFLHQHSYYSVLDGLASPAEICKRAKELGHKAVAITDHASVSCLPEFIASANDYDIKPIVGCEFYVVDDLSNNNSKRYHLTVFAKNWIGFQSIMAQLTLANKQFARRARLSFEQALNFKDCVVSSACVMGILRHDDYKSLTKRFHQAYGDDFYVEIMPTPILIDDQDLQRVINERAEEMVYQEGVAPLVTLDSHYANANDEITHKVLLAVQSKQKWNSKKRFDFDCPPMMGRGEIEFLFNEHNYNNYDVVKDGLNNTIQVADKCNLVVPKLEVHLPDVSTEDFRTLFQREIVEGWKKHILGKKLDDATYKLRLVTELEVIRKLNLEKYFLIVQDFIKWAEGKDILLGPGRGSSGGSLICYLMGITKIDPIKYGLLFERFLNVDRADSADIDTDVQDDRRQEVIDYLRSKYGYDKTCGIGTFGRLSVKSAFRDVCSVFDIPSYEVNYLSKLIVDEKSFETIPELREFARKHRDIVEQAIRLDGVIRSLGTHAAGLVVSSEPIQNVAVVENRSGIEVCNWDKKYAEKMGLLKLDLLGLSTLSVLKRCVDLVKSTRGVDIDIYSIPVDDPKTIEMFQSGRGVGIFQFEGFGSRSLLKEVKPKTLDDIATITALYRPGPLTAMVDDNNTMVQQYVKVSKAQSYPSYLHPRLTPILESTNGVIVYQEQIMAIVRELAGFTLAEADQLRRIIGRKMSEAEFEPHRIHFVDNAVKNGMEEGDANFVFAQLKKFALYGFNHSHSIEYAYISYISMYLKTHYPLEYMAALLNNTTKTDKIPVYVKEATRLGLTINMPDINRSDKDFIIKDGEIVIPFGAIKGVGDKAVEAIMEAKANGPILSYEAFERSVGKRVCNKRVRETLIRAGVFESVGMITQDEEQREKDKSELLSSFFSLPTIVLTKDKVDHQLIQDMMDEAKQEHPGLINPVPTIYSGIMVINKKQKNESAHLQAKGTKYILDVLKDVGISERYVYYTSYNKWSNENLSQEQEELCISLLKREIEIVKPKLIICCDSTCFHLFTSESIKTIESSGRVIYDKKLDTYVMFSVTPQYAFYMDEGKAAFEGTIFSLESIFSS